MIACGTNDELVKLVGRTNSYRFDRECGTGKNGGCLAERYRGAARHRGGGEDRARWWMTVIKCCRGSSSAATQQSARITSVDIREPNLEAVFLHLTGRALRDE